MLVAFDAVFCVVATVFSVVAVDRFLKPPARRTTAPSIEPCMDPDADMAVCRAYSDAITIALAAFQAASAETTTPTPTANDANHETTGTDRRRSITDTMPMRDSIIPAIMLFGPSPTPTAIEASWFLSISS